MSIENFNGMQNTNGFAIEKNKININRKGQPKSIRRDLLEALSTNTELFIPNKNIIERTDLGVLVHATNSQKITDILLKWTNSKNPAASLKAIETILNYTEPKVMPIYHEEQPLFPDPSKEYRVLNLAGLTDETLRAVSDAMDENENINYHILEKEVLIDLLENINELK